MPAEQSSALLCLSSGLLYQARCCPKAVSILTTTVPSKKQPPELQVRNKSIWQRENTSVQVPSKRKLRQTCRAATSQGQHHSTNTRTKKLFLVAIVLEIPFAIPYLSCIKNANISCSHHPAVPPARWRLRMLPAAGPCHFQM